jgi:hypothetical protein
MLDRPTELIESFIKDAHSQLELSIDASAIAHESWRAPHQPKDLQPGCGAVYVFSLSNSSKAPASSHRVLKVGKASASSNPRFRYQHYAANSAQSTLAGAILNNPLLWNYVGYPGGPIEVGKWIRDNTDRDNFYFKDSQLIGLFEVYAKARLGPAFEGSLSSKSLTLGGTDGP